jgi:hypothetical protein
MSMYGTDIAILANYESSTTVMGPVRPVMDPRLTLDINCRGGTQRQRIDLP